MAEHHRRKSDGREGAGLADKAWPTVARQREKRAQLLAQSARGAAIFNSNGHLVDCNDAYRAMHDLPIELLEPGTSLDDILAHQIDQGAFPDSDPETYIAAHMNMVRKTDVQTRVEVMPSGQVISVGYFPVEGGGWISTLDDITDLYAIKEELEHSSYYDRRTSLPNERLLMRCLDDAMAEQWDEESFAVLAVDFSTFDPKMTQIDKDSHHALHVEIAERLARTVRKSDVPAKLDGAKFAIIEAEVTSQEDALALARRLSTVLAMPYTIGGSTLLPSFNVGIALPEGDDIDEDQLLKNAFVAAEQARSSSTQRYGVFQNEPKCAAA